MSLVLDASERWKVKTMFPPAVVTVGARPESGCEGFPPKNVFEGVGDSIEIRVGIGCGIGDREVIDPAGEAGAQGGEFDLLVGEIVGDFVADRQAGDGGEIRASEAAEAGDDQLRRGGMPVRSRVALVMLRSPVTLRRSAEEPRARWRACH